MSEVATHLMQAKGLMQRGEFSKAKGVLAHAVQKAPTDQSALMLMRYCLAHLGEHGQALYYAEKAAKLFPTSADVQTNLAGSLVSNGRVGEALERLRRITGEVPGHLPSRLMLTQVLLREGRMVECLKAVQDGFLRYQNEPRLALAGATAMLAMGRADEAVMALKPVCLQHPTSHQLLQMLAAAHLYASDVEPADVMASHEVFGRVLAAGVQPIREPFANTKDADRPLRIGIVSGDFRKHALYFFMTRLLESYDRSRMSIVLYHNCPAEDEHTHTLRDLAARDNAGTTWRDISAVHHDAAARLIRSDQIDVLIDYSGLTQGGSLPAFAMRAAPVQATWLGYPYSTGLRAMDYRLTDAALDPVDAPAGHVPDIEKPLRMDGVSFCWKAPDDAPALNPVPPSARAPGAGITFGCFTTLQKLNERTVRAWSRIVRETPGSRLFLKHAVLKQEEVAAVTRRRFELAGLDPARLILEGPQVHGSTLIGAYERVDIALDTWPYNGHTSTLEAAWMGVPTVTRTNPYPAGRVGAQINGLLGLGELVADDDEAYITRAVALAKDEERLSEIRRSLRGKLGSSPICDGPAFARGFEKAMREAWAAWCVK